MERGHDMTKSQKGTLCVFAAALLYSIGGLCIKLIPWGGMAINGSRTRHCPGGDRGLSDLGQASPAPQPLGRSGSHLRLWL